MGTTSKVLSAASLALLTASLPVGVVSAAPGDINTEIVVSIYQDGAGAMDGAPDGGPLPDPTSNATDPATGTALTWDAGEDQNVNNLVVRTFDQMVYRADWNVNEEDVVEVDGIVTNVVVALTLEDAPGTPAKDIVWDPSPNSIPPTCLTTGVTPVSAVSADGLTFTCNLGP